MNVELRKQFNKLEKLTAELIGAIENTTTAQLHQSPPGKWSLSQVFAHRIVKEVAAELGHPGFFAGPLDRPLHDLEHLFQQLGLKLFRRVKEFLKLFLPLWRDIAQLELKLPAFEEGVAWLLSERIQDGFAPVWKHRKRIGNEDFVESLV